jgi:precorrin-4 methylase
MDCGTAKHLRKGLLVARHTLAGSLLMFFLAILASHGVCPRDVLANTHPETRLYLVSVGNGDPDNITLRALRTIENADVLFCMDGIREKFPDIVKGKEIHHTTVNVHKTYMRKQGNFDAALKDVKRIEAIVRKAVEEGKTVAVLDSGDPTIYGPNMWFMEVFEDLNPEIVPGVSCFNAANAALKKGVAAGEKTRSVILSNGFEIEKLAQARTSMVFFTMHLDIDEIAEKLTGYYSPETPVAIVIDAGYREKERIIRGTLATIRDRVKGEKLSAHLVYVGDFLTKRYGIGDIEAAGGRDENGKGKGLSDSKR